MILYNVTLNVEEGIHEEWQAWMIEKHIPDVMATGMFLDYQMCKLISHQEQGVTYAIQYRCKDMKTLHNYQTNHAPELQKEVIEKYADKCVAFRTLLEVIDHNTHG